MSIPDNQDNVTKLLKDLSINDFLTVGLNQVAYIKQVKNDQKQPSFVVHAADGSQLSVMETYDMALVTLRLNDLYPVTVH